MRTQPRFKSLVAGRRSRDHETLRSGCPYIVAVRAERSMQAPAHLSRWGPPHPTQSDWRRGSACPAALLQECEFIVASRPRYSLADVANPLPEKLRPAPAVIKPFSKQPAKRDLVLSGARVHLLDSVHQPISATAIRQAAAAKKPLKKFVDPPVEEYIKKIGLYK